MIYVLGLVDLVAQVGHQPAENLSTAIQMSVAPVFLLAGIGGLLVVLNSRLVRIIDRSRELQALTQSRDTPVSSERESKTELSLIHI